MSHRLNSETPTSIPENRRIVNTKIPSSHLSLLCRKDSAAGDAGRGPSLGHGPRDPSPRNPERRRGTRRKRWGTGGQTVGCEASPPLEDVGRSRGPSTSLGIVVSERPSTPLGRLVPSLSRDERSESNHGRTRCQELFDRALRNKLRTVDGRISIHPRMLVLLGLGVAVLLIGGVLPLLSRDPYNGIDVKTRCSLITGRTASV